MIPVSLAGLVATWGAAIVLMGLGTFGGVDGAAAWALMCAAAAASWTVIHALARQQQMLCRAFELGRAEGVRSMRPVR